MNDEEVKAYYREVERYDWVEDTRYPAKLFHQLRARHIVTLANRLIQPDWYVVDVGCGTGLITQSLLGHVTGVDINPWALERAKYHCPYAQFETADSESLPFTSNSIDVVVCSDMLEHLTDPQPTLREVQRVLKLGGYLIGEVPSTFVVWNYQQLCGSAYKCREPFHHTYTIREVRAMLQLFHCERVRFAVLGCEISFVVRKD